MRRRATVFVANVRGRVRKIPFLQRKALAFDGPRSRTSLASSENQKQSKATVRTAGHFGGGGGLRV